MSGGSFTPNPTQSSDYEDFHYARKGPRPAGFTPISGASSYEGHATYDPCTAPNVAVPGLMEGFSPNPELQSTAPDWFAFSPDKETQFCPTAGSLDQDIGLPMLSCFPTTLTTSREASFAEPTTATDASLIPSIISQAQERRSRVQILDSSASLPRRRSRYNIQIFGQKTEARPIPIQTPALDPLQRWQESPPEYEPASMSAIMQARIILAFFWLKEVSIRGAEHFSSPIL
ncbi:hypothetical protein N7462_002578 [Penicillium macrosclerotiorum]|uniref:uncharacterized protein n=1 Tax=Penicillium macrosclerotiorum TaxID=303699 RepID=UPI002548BF32|nr:uncharacterized protein N7462_002578 [Penicillium macrosclerotiorum]KAJ5693155.1 hypothetical protein N7462_002578 [Penicillium macrosclerotiorum]